MTMASRPVGAPPRRLTDSALLWATLGAVVTAHVGAHVDAWAHVHRGFAVESFWTWSHALLYAGKAATAGLLAGYLLESWRRREPRARWLPPGYPLVGLGVLLFFVGGAVDLLWHRWVGVEATLEALLSPAHLWLVAASWLSALGLLRAALAARGTAPRRTSLDVSVVLSLAILYRITNWCLFYTDPTAVDYMSGGARVRELPAFAGLAWANAAATIAGVTGIILSAVVFAVFLVGLLRHLALPPGSVAAIVGWNATLAAAVSGLWLSLIPAAGAAGVGESVAAWIRRGGLGGPTQSRGYWVLAFSVPAVQVALTIGVLACLGGSLRWTTHLWAGMPVVAGAYGFVVSLLVLPPSWLRAR